MGHISFVGKLDAVTLRAGAPAIAPNFTLELMAKHSLDFWLTSEDLPDSNNRVTIDRNGKIVLSYTPNNLEAHERLQAKLKQALKHHHCPVHGHDCHEGLFGRNLYAGQRIPLAGVAHQNGTIRFGHNPKTSALDVNCKGARPRQPVCGGWQLLSVERGSEPGADHHGQRFARGRTHPGSPGRNRQGHRASTRGGEQCLVGSHSAGRVWHGCFS
jgi:hypothetical protein